MKNKFLSYFLITFSMLFFVGAAFADGLLPPLDAPTNITVSNVTYQGVTISWTPATPPAGILVGFTITATPVNSSDPVVVVNARSTDQKTLPAGNNGLQLGVTYNVTIVAYENDTKNKYSSSQPSSPVVPFTMPDTAPVSNIQVNSITSNSANITWSPAQDIKNKNANFTYTVQIKPADAGSSVPMPPQPGSTTNTSVSVSQLQPATMYQFTIEAKGSDGSDITSQPYWLLTTAKTSYLMLNLPVSSHFPIYVYQQQGTGALNQITYLAGSSQDLFLSDYNPTSTSGNYELYYADKSSKSGYKYCTISLSNGQIVSSQNQCPDLTSITQFPIVPANGGAEFIQPNAYAVNVGSGNWTAAPTAPPSPIATNYGQARTLTFVNNTQYKAIRVGMACTVSLNPYNPNCQNVSDIFAAEFPNGLPQGESAVFTVDNPAVEKTHYPAGLDSTAFYVSAYQNSDGSWVTTGGYGANPAEKHPYATKMELTWQGIKADPNQGPVSWVQNTNLDVSAVDGYNFGFILYPAFPTYCLATIGGESTNAMGVDVYGEQNPIAQLLPQNNESLSELCASSSQLPSGSSGTPWNLSLLSSTGDFKGCYNPCSYAVANNLPQKTIDKYCCTGKEGTWQTCDVAGTSSYVTNMNPPISTGIYRFAYDDATGDFGCPGMANYVVKIVSTAANTIAISGTPTVTPTLNSANVSWNAATDSSESAAVNYTVQLAYAGQETVPVPNSAITVSNDTAQISELIPNTTYQATVVASDNSGAVAAYPVVTFTTTKTVPYQFTITQPVVTNVEETTATVNWTASDNDPKANPITYTVTATPSSGSPIVETVKEADTLNLTGLTANTTYTVVVSGVDSDNNKATSTPSASFTTQKSAAKSFVVIQDPVDPAIVQWDPSTVPGETSSSFVSAVATPVNGGASIATGQYGWKEPRIDKAYFSFTGLTAGQTYSVVVTLNVGGELYQSVPIEITP